jgi:hypothetical protein
MSAKQDNKVLLAVQFLLLADKSTKNKSVKEAMKDASFSEAEIKNSSRAKEAAVRRAYNEIKNKKTLSFMEMPEKEINVFHNIPISPLYDIQSASSNDTAMITVKSTKSTKSNKMIPGIRFWT